MPKKTAPSTISGHAADIWEAAYESAWKAYNPDKHTGTQEAYAAKTAWTAVKNAGYIKDKKTGKWVKAKAQTLSFRLRITKSRVDGATGRVHWHAQAANDEIDTSDQEVLDPSLFDDLATTFNMVMEADDAGEPLPEFWFGQARVPILDLSHYSALLLPENRDKARLGSVTKLYRDGRYLHAAGFFDNTEMGKLAVRSIAADEAGEIRVSVGFWPDWGNFKVENDILYFMGGRNQAVLDHLAVTSVPRIPSTSIGVGMEEVTMADDTVTTMAEDAQVILGDDGEAIVAALEKMIEDQEMQGKSMVLKGEGEEEIVESAEPVEPTEPAVEDAEPEVEPLAETTEASEIPAEEVPEAEVVAEEEVSESVEEETPVADAMKEKSDVVPVAVEPHQPFGGATSFDDALEQQKAITEKWRIEDGWRVLQSVMDNILADPEVADKQVAIAGAMAQYQTFLRSGEALWSDAGIDTCVCPECGKEVAHEKGTPCSKTECPKCGATMVPKTDKVDKSAAVVPEVEPAVEGEPESAEVVEEEPVVAEDATSEDESVVVPEPEVTSTPEPEVEPAAMVMGDAPVQCDLAGTPPTPSTDQEYSRTPHRAGRGSTWADVLARTNGPPERPARKSISTPPAPTTPAAAPVEAANESVQTLVASEVAQAMQAVLAELAALKQSLQSTSAVKEEPTPPRPVRKSAPPIQPAKVTTRAKTFSDVVDRLYDLE